MAKLFRITMFLLVLHAVHSYILLTAHVDDLRNIGKRVMGSAIRGQVGNIVRRAYDVFNTNLGKARVNMRANDENDFVFAYKPDDDIYRKKGDPQNSESDDQQSSSHDEKPEKFPSLGRRASVYLQKIQKIFEKA